MNPFRSTPVLFLSTLVLSGLGVVAIAFAAPSGVPLAPTAEVVAVASAAAPAPVAVQAPPAPDAAPQAHAVASTEGLRYPDGSVRAGLNGVTDRLEPSFTDCLPFAPIVGVERDYHGLDWYVHANGARSTSFRDGRGLPFALAYMPGPQRPSVD